MSITACRCGTVGQGADWGHHKHGNRKAARPVTHLAELVRQITERCFLVDTLAEMQNSFLQNKGVNPLL